MVAVAARLADAAATASASYRGRAGALVYQDYYSWEGLAYGDGSADNWNLSEVRGSSHKRIVSCQEDSSGGGLPGRGR